MNTSANITSLDESGSYPSIVPLIIILTVFPLMGLRWMCNELFFQN